jgi:hypothetical protein
VIKHKPARITPSLRCRRARLSWELETCPHTFALRSSVHDSAVSTVHALKIDIPVPQSGADETPPVHAIPCVADKKIESLYPLPPSEQQPWR